VPYIHTYIHTYMCTEMCSSLVPRLLPSFLSLHVCIKKPALFPGSCTAFCCTVCDKKLGRSLGLIWAWSVLCCRKQLINNYRSAKVRSPSWHTSPHPQRKWSPQRSPHTYQMPYIPSLPLYSSRWWGWSVSWQALQASHDRLYKCIKGHQYSIQTFMVPNY